MDFITLVNDWKTFFFCLNKSTPHWFERDPGFAWGFFGHRLMLYKSTLPHAGFNILKKLCHQKDNYFVYTSNVDGHFQKAGFHEDHIVECHGALSHMQNLQGTGQLWPCPDDFTVSFDSNTFRAAQPLPRGPPGIMKVQFSFVDGN